MRGFRRVYLFPEGLPPRVISEVLEIPGTQWYGDVQPDRPERAHPRLRIPLTARHLVEGILRYHNATWTPYLEEMAGGRLTKFDPADVVTLRSPRPYQLETVRFLLPRRGGIMDIPCGLGKTYTTLLYTESVRAAEPEADQRVVIFTRATTTYQWVGQIVEAFGKGKYTTRVIEEGGVTELRERKAPSTGTFQARDTGQPVTSVEAAQDLVRAAVRAQGVKVREMSVVKAAQTLLSLPQRLRASDASQKLLARLGLGVASAALPPDYCRWGVYRKGTGEQLSEWRHDALEAQLSATEDEVEEWRQVAGASSIQPKARWEAACKIYWARVTSGTWPTREDGQPRRLPVLRGAELQMVEDWTPEERWTVEGIGQEEAGKRYAYQTWGQDTAHLEGIDYLILSWALMNPLAELIRSWKPTTIILDEAHTAQNHRHWRKVVGYNNEETWERVDHVAAWAAYLTEDPKTPRNVLLLTATPAPNRVKNWWALCNLYDPRSMGKFRDFALRYCGGYEGQYGFIADGVSNPEELNSRLRHFVYTLDPATAERELPPLITLQVRLPMSQARIVKVSKQEYMAAQRRGSAALRELQLAINATAKEPYILRRVLEAAQDKLRVCVMTGRKMQVDRLYTLLQKHLPQTFGLWKVHGDETPDLKERDAIIQAYRNAPGGGCIIATTPAMGEAVDGLQVTNLALLAMLPDSAGKFIQLRGRWRRLGGITCELELILLEESIDEDQLDLLLDKSEQIAQVQNNGSIEELRVSLETTAADEEALLLRMTDKIVANMAKWTISEDDDNEHHLGTAYTAKVTGDNDHGD